MTLVGQVVFLIGVVGIAIGLVSATVMTLDAVKEADQKADDILKPAPPPSPAPSPPVARKLQEQFVRAEVPKQNLFDFSPDEEKRVLRAVQQSMTRARAATPVSH